jgi:fucose 4-O-acetylase-like acetyltransferase
MNWLSLSVAFNVIMVVAVVVIIKAMGDTIIKFELEKLKLLDKLVLAERQLMAEQMRRVTTVSKPSIDSKTMSLLVLAVSNTNENEARSAAMQVCKRLKKKLP